MNRPAVPTSTRRPGARPSRRRRLLVTLAVLLALLLAAGAGGGYVFLRRSLPQLEGRLSLPGLREPVTVYRDARGVPHIVAANAHDLYFAQGFVTAQDRLFQMDLTRRAVSGRLAEVFGEGLLDTDRYFRTLTLRRAAEASLAVLPPDVLDVLEAYAAGVNAFIEQAASAGRLPPEFTILGYRPEPWTPADTMALAKLMAWDLGGNWEGEVWRYLLAERLGEERVRELWPEYPPDGPTILREVRRAGLRVDGLLATLRGDRSNLGSNNWVVAGSRTRSGKPMLANDPHLGVDLPAIWYQTHLSLPAEDFEVIGATFPGAPGIVIGHNRHVAWGVTNLGPDVQDLYVERPSPDDPHRFEYNGRYEQATVYREEIRVKGRAEPVVHEVVVTRHGPIVSGVAGTEDERPQAQLALRWTALQPTAEPAAILAVNRARNWDEFREALRHFHAPAQNFVFAAADGTIAYRGQGLIPIRRKGNGMLPVPGWTDEYEWVGFIPFDELPEVVNPPEGYVATANHRVAGDDYPYFLAVEWASPYRAMRIDRVLAGARDWTVEEMKALQNDTVNLQAETLLPVLLPAARAGLERAGGPAPLEARALEILEQWDRVDGVDSAGAAVWHAWYGAVVRELFLAELGEEMLATMPGVRQVTDRLLLEAAAGRPASWFGDRGLEGVAADALRAAVAELERRLGDDAARWRWGELHQVLFDHPLGRVKPLDLLFNAGPLPVAGSGVTVLAAGFDPAAEDFTVTSGPVWKQVVDLADPAGNSWDALAPGQSGHPLSPHFDDQASMWTRGEYGRMLVGDAAAAGGRRLELLPAGGQGGSH